MAFSQYCMCYTCCVPRLQLELNQDCMIKCSNSFQPTRTISSSTSCHHITTDRKALFRFTINTTASGSWYFYLDNTWPHVYSEQDCYKKIAAAKFSSRYRHKACRFSQMSLSHTHLLPGPIATHSTHIYNVHVITFLLPFLFFSPSFLLPSCSSLSTN